MEEPSKKEKETNESVRKKVQTRRFAGAWTPLRDLNLKNKINKIKEKRRKNREKKNVKLPIFRSLDRFTITNLGFEPK